MKKMTKTKIQSKEKESKVIDIDRYIDHITGESNDQYDPIVKSYDFTTQGDTTDSTGLWQSEINALADMQTIESMFFSEDWVYIVVDLVSQKISSQPLAVMKKEVVDGVERIQFADSHPLNDLIAQPNTFQDYHAWMYNFTTQYTLMGNAINWYSESLNQIVTLRTSRVTMDFSNDGSINKYIVTEQTEDNPIGDQSNRSISYFEPEQIMHTTRPNPASIIWGLSPFVPGRKSILFNRYSSDYLNSFYLKQATPGMILEVDSTANEKNMIRQLRSFEMAYTGRRNMRRTMILPKGVKANAASHTIADQKLIDLLQNNRETILAILKVPKHEVGLQTGGSLGSEEYKAALKNFWTATLTPTMRMIEGSLNKFFKKELGENFFFKFDLSQVEILQENIVEKAELGQKMLQSGLSINEVRKMVWETEPSIAYGTDDPFILRTPAQQQFTNFQRPSDNVDNDIQKEKMLEGETKDIDSLELKLKSIIEGRNKGFLDMMKKTIDELADGEKGQEMSDIALEILLSMTKASYPIIKKNLKSTKASEIISKRKLKRELEKSIDKFELDYTNRYTNSLKSVVEIGYDSQLEMVFDSKDREKIETIREQTADRRSSTLKARGLDSFAYISETHTDSIIRQIVIGTEKGESIGKIIERVKDSLGDADGMIKRADTIGRTETLTAASVGQGAALENAAEAIPGTKKAWLNVGDDRVRDTHLDKSVGGVSGEIVGSTEPFSNGLRWPRDLKSGEASEVINCRCTLITLPPGEDLDV